MSDVFGVECERGGLLGRLLEQDGLEQRLDDVHHAARACSKVVPSAIVSSSPRPHSDKFGSGETGGESRVAPPLPPARAPGRPPPDSQRPAHLPPPTVPLLAPP